MMRTALIAAAVWLGMDYAKHWIDEELSREFAEQCEAHEGRLLSGPAGDAYCVSTSAMLRKPDDVE